MAASIRALETRDLTVRYGEFTAADAVSVHAARGEILGLLGPNGAGKTSVIRALTTVVPVSGGGARVNGHDLRDQKAVRSSIGVLPESNGYPSAQTAASYLRYYGQLFGLPRDEAGRRAGRLLTRVGLGGNENRIATFSRGMRQRLGLARALINDPKVVFLDEPTLGLDPAGKQDILAQLTASAIEDGTCVILCSHLLDEVERVCDRVAIMNEARIVAMGTVDDVVVASGVTDHATVRVRPVEVVAAEKALRACQAVGQVSFDNTRPGDLRVRVSGTGGEVLRALLEAWIEPRAFDLRGARLSDAFLALTSSEGDSK